MLGGCLSLVPLTSFQASRMLDGYYGHWLNERFWSWGGILLTLNILCHLYGSSDIPIVGLQKVAQHAWVL